MANQHTSTAVLASKAAKVQQLKQEIEPTRSLEWASSNLGNILRERLYEAQNRLETVNLTLEAFERERDDLNKTISMANAGLEIEGNGIPHLELGMEPDQS